MPFIPSPATSADRWQLFTHSANAGFSSAWLLFSGSFESCPTLRPHCDKWSQDATVAFQSQGFFTLLYKKLANSRKLFPVLFKASLSQWNSDKMNRYSLVQQCFKCFTKHVQHKLSACSLWAFWKSKCYGFNFCNYLTFNDLAKRLQHQQHMAQ